LAAVFSLERRLGLPPKKRVEIEMVSWFFFSLENL
jgi:hypothetical protein